MAIDDEFTVRVRELRITRRDQTAQPP